MTEENTTVVQEETSEKKSLSGRLFKCAVILIFLLVCIAALLFLCRDRIVAFAIRRGGSILTGTDVRLQEFSSDFSGKFKLKGFSVSNPQGYSSKNAIEFKELSADLDLPSFFRRKRVIRQILLRGIRVHLETSSDETNFDRLQKNIKKFMSTLNGETSNQAELPPAPEDTDSEFLIKKFDTEDSQLSYAAASINQPVAFELPPVRLRNIGGKSAKDTAIQLVTKFFAAARNRFANAGKMIAEILRSTGENLVEETKKTGSKIQETGTELVHTLKENVHLKKRE